MNYGKVQIKLYDEDNNLFFKDEAKLGDKKDMERINTNLKAKNVRLVSIIKVNSFFD